MTSAKSADLCVGRVLDALKEKGYNPISQIVGYILSEDPTYIPTHNNARSLIRRIDRDELLKAMVRSYPVSYTHLDVYKRQGHPRARAPVSAPPLQHRPQPGRCFFYPRRRTALRRPPVSAILGQKAEEEANP